MRESYRELVYNDYIMTITTNLYKGQCIMTTHNLEELQAIIQQLTAKIEAVEAKQTVTRKRGGKAPVEKVSKPYAGLSGHYFSLTPTEANAEVYKEMNERVAALLTQDFYTDKVNKSQLGRAIMNHFKLTGCMIFWAPNQNDLMFGPVLAGRNTAQPAEIFVIEPSALVDLGHGHAEDKAGKALVEKIVNLEAFIQLEKLEVEQAKLQSQLDKLNSK